MNFAWKFMLPMALVNLVTTRLAFSGAGIDRWVVCSLLIVVAYVLLGRSLMQGSKLEKRIYRYAE